MVLGNRSSLPTNAQLDTCPPLKARIKGVRLSPVNFPSKLRVILGGTSDALSLTRLPYYFTQNLHEHVIYIPTLTLLHSDKT